MSPLSVSGQDKIFHKPFASFHGLYLPSSMLRKPKYQSSSSLQSPSSGLDISQSTPLTFEIKAFDAKLFDSSFAMSRGVVFHFFPSFTAPFGTLLDGIRGERKALQLLLRFDGFEERDSLRNDALEISIVFGVLRRGVVGGRAFVGLAHLKWPEREAADEDGVRRRGMTERDEAPQELRGCAYHKAKPAVLRRCGF
nr:hypothetical protein Iba_chr07eCG9330 [Ipomoea batatas]GMD21212.1 hypothetical protein Iba_chr07fCG11990 [Ipomoea batatas]